MTGPAYGKVPIDIEVIVNGKRLNCDAYIHLKGYARARVTHIDLEGFNVTGEKTGCRTVGFEDGFAIILFKPVFIEGELVKKIIIRGLKLLDIGERRSCILGIKDGGLFIGFESSVLTKLEKIGKDLLDKSYQKVQKT